MSSVLGSPLNKSIQSHAPRKYSNHNFHIGAPLDSYRIVSKTMGSVTGKRSRLRRLKSRFLSSSCFAPSTVDPEEDKIGSKNPENKEINESGASSSCSNPIRKKKTRFGSIAYKIGFRLGRMLSLVSTRSKNLHSSNVSVPNNVSEEIISVETNTPQHDVAITSNNFFNAGVHDETVQNNRRIASNWQEPLENSARFGRTLSVGRLRDRVLRRTLSNNVVLFGLEDRSGVEYNAQISDIRVMSGGSRRVANVSDSEVWEDYLRGRPNGGGRIENESRIMQFGDRNMHVLLERTSLFLERRRRIRSQVLALQRLGSRFGNLSGHERSCILSSHHRTGRCSCRVSNHVVNANEDNTGTRGSISRIVLLAEALFEVLDEIHQHSVALTSRSSYSSLGSVPAPKEVVECMPVKVYCRPQKHQNEEAAQCYICLLEYEDGDYMRVLPCNHEFHQTCVDKWLKEVHRVCPLCRGDVCRSGVFGADHLKQ